MRALAPHWGALLALTLFLVAGLAVLDDYGIVRDSIWQRRTAEANLSYLASGDIRASTSALLVDHNKFYGMAFEVPLLLAERVFGMEDSRAVYSSRHLITHLFYLAGGVFAYLLALRLFGARLPAVAAMLLFLLHPRLYANSFFNSKDIPFLAMFIVALFLTHRTFKRDSVTEARFFLHIVPDRADDLPEARRGHGFDNLDFDFFPNGVLFDGRCAARVALPDYAITSIQTRQFTRGVGAIWSAEAEIGSKGRE